MDNTEGFAYYGIAHNCTYARLSGDLFVHKKVREEAREPFCHARLWAIYLSLLSAPILVMRTESGKEQHCGIVLQKKPSGFFFFLLSPDFAPPLN